MRSKLIALLLVILLSPLMIGISLIILIFDGWPIFFVQERVGYAQNTFHIYKFRTMKHSKIARNQMKEKILQSERDARVTYVGKRLRNYSLDELPQLLNILSGNMEFIGPRPIIPEQLNAITSKRHYQRFRVKPGLTGLSQIKGRRSLSWPQQLKYDVFYSSKKSFYLDLLILYLTIRVVFKKEGIYGSSSDNWRNYLRIDKENNDL